MHVQIVNLFKLFIPSVTAPFMQMIHIKRTHFNAVEAESFESSLVD